MFVYVIKFVYITSNFQLIPVKFPNENISKILQLNIPWKVSGNLSPFCNPSNRYNF